MQTAPTVRRWWPWLAYFSLWTGLGVFNTVQSCLMRLASGSRCVLWELAVIGVADWYVWAGLAPLVFFLSRRFPLEGRVWIRHLPLHVAFCVFCMVLVAAMMVPVFNALDPAFGAREQFRRLPLRVVAEAHVYLWVYWGIVGVSHAWEYHQRYRERELRAAELESRLAQARLQVLKMQLDPHFLFNTLHAVSALIHRDPDAAETMLARLGDMLRETLDRIDTQEVSLREELAFADAYLEIQRIRLGDRLAVTMDIDPQTLEVFVPNLILQPLVENAIRHGIEPLPQGGRLKVQARRGNGILRLEVRDDGPGIRNFQPASARNGVGLANTRARLQYLYGTEHDFEIANAPGGGAVIRLGIPWRAQCPLPQTTSTSGEHTDSDSR